MSGPFLFAGYKDFAYSKSFNAGARGSI